MNINAKTLDNWYDRFSLLRHPGFGLNEKQLSQPLKQLSNRLQNQEHSTATARSTVLNNRTVDNKTTTVQNGNQTNTTTAANIVDTVDISTQKQLSQQSEQVATAKANGKETYARNLKDTEQSVNEKRHSTTAETRNAAANTTRDVQKAGNQTKTVTHTDTTGNQQANTVSEYNRTTDTQTRYKTYDKNGQLVSNKYNHQVVDVDQDTATNRATQSQGTRDIEQTSTTVQLKEGNASIRKVNTETADVTKNQQVINSQTSTTTKTNVQNLDEAGQTTSTRAYSQQSDSVENRTIASERSVNTDQDVRILTHGNKTETNNTTHTQVAGETKDNSVVQTTTNNFDQTGSLTSNRNSTRQTDTITTEERDIVNQTQTSVEKNNGHSMEKTEVEAREAYSLQTHTEVDQDGAKSERQIITQGEINTWGDVKNQLKADGDRYVKLSAEQTKDIITSDQTISANNQAKNTTTTTWAAQMVDGEVDFDAANKASGTAAPGKIIIDMGSNTGLRASFKMDDGVLKFDFRAQRMDTSVQTSVSSTGDKTPITNKESLDDLHFTGQVVSSTDTAGNRVLTLEGRVVSDQDAMMMAGTGFQTEDRETEYEFSGNLTVNRLSTQDGSTTTQKVTSNSQLNVSKVDNMETNGYNLRNLTSLTSADAVKAGFVYNDNAIRFNFGTFNIGISFQA